MKLAKALLASTITLTLSEAAHAALYDRGNGMIYDSTLNITWLQDANYANTSGYTDNVSANGLMTYYQATAWASTLVYGGYSGWRLASAKLNDSWTAGGIGYYDGTYDESYNNSRSEIGSLFFELGNRAAYDTSGAAQPGFGTTHTSFVDAGTNQTVQFFNLQNSVYWEAELNTHTGNEAWAFYTENGLQSSQRSTGFSEPAYAWAVHDGDIAAAPIPATAWLFGSSLIGLVSIFKRNKA